MRIGILTAREEPGYVENRLTEEAEKRGHTVVLIDHSKAYITVASGQNHVVQNELAITDLDAIIPRIGASITRYGAAVVRQFEMQGVYTLVSSLALVRSRDKLRSLQLLGQKGVGIPKTVLARSASVSADQLIDEVGGTPVIIKLARGTQGNGVILAETRKAARSVLQAFYVLDEDGTNILLQEYIEESGGEDIRVFIVGGKVVASMKRKSLDDEFRSNIHQGGNGIAIKLTDEEKKTAIKAARAMGLNVCGVDMMRSKRGPLVLEVNSSPGFAIEKVTGRNVAASIIDYIEMNARRRPRKDKIGA